METHDEHLSDTTDPIAAGSGRYDAAHSDPSAGDHVPGDSADPGMAPLASEKQGHGDKSDAPASPIEQIQSQALEATIVEVLKTIYDPEIPVNIYELGLIYEIDVQEEGQIAIMMTLTSPACPVAGTLVTEVERRVRDIGGVTDCRVDLVWDPPWTPDRLSEAARLQLNL
ncbi:MAG: SUF system Fe-S cluster assembly protein [Planctomycetota bacterium]|jgi:FeS assembly SUF system protein